MTTEYPIIRSDKRIQDNRIRYLEHMVIEYMINANPALK